MPQHPTAPRAALIPKHPLWWLARQLAPYLLLVVTVFGLSLYGLFELAAALVAWSETPRINEETTSC